MATPGTVHQDVEPTEANGPPQIEDGRFHFPGLNLDYPRRLVQVGGSLLQPRHYESRMDMFLNFGVESGVKLG